MDTIVERFYVATIYVRILWMITSRYVGLFVVVIGPSFYKEVSTTSVLVQRKRVLILEYYEYSRGYQWASPSSKVCCKL